MRLQIYTCSRCVGKKYEFIKYGKTLSGKQRYQCTGCKKTSVLQYTYNAYKQVINSEIVQLTREGVGIRSTARILRISPTTVLKRILDISKTIRPPALHFHKEYQVDEVCTYVRKKSNRIWIVYALETHTKTVACFSVGRRTNRTLSKVLQALINSNPCKILTDGLKNYAYLIPQPIHQTKRYGTNAIERKNLCLRTHIKRLARRTICFSRSAAMLSAVLKIFFWKG